MTQILEKSKTGDYQTSFKLIKNIRKLDNFNCFEEQIKQDSSLRLYDKNNKRYFDFTEFALLGKQFAKAVAETFIFYSSSVALDTAQSAYSAILRFLRWLLLNKNRHHELTFTLLENYKRTNASDWENAVADWREDIIAGSTIGSVRKRNLISALQTFSKNLIVRGVIPKISFARIPAYLRNSARPTKCLAEAVQINTSKENSAVVENYLSKNKKYDVKLNIKRDFLTVLLQEKGSIAGTEHEHAKELLKVNVERLSLLRECAVEDFHKWRIHWYKGQELLKTAIYLLMKYKVLLNSHNLCVSKMKRKFFQRMILKNRLLGY